jgi:Flp pilus assembly protein TadG
MRRDQRGAATAELAMAVPLLVALTIGLVWLLSVGLAQIRMVDAAREAARAAARGETAAQAESRGQEVAPAGSLVVLSTAGDQVSVTVTGSSRPPGGLLGFLPAVGLHAQAVAAVEELP